MLHEAFAIDVNDLRGFWENKLGVSLTNADIAMWLDDTIVDATGA